jgi:hemoglobin
MGLINRDDMLRAAGLSASLFVGACLTLSTGCTGKNDNGEQRTSATTKPTTRPTTRPAVSRTGTLFDRLGGEAGIRVVVNDFVRRAAADPAVNFTRKGHENEWQPTKQNLERLKQRLVEFVATTAGAPSRYQYQGKDMVSAHKGMGITNAEFDALAGHLAAALEANNVSRREREELLSAVGSTRSAIVEAPDHAQDETAEAPMDELGEEPTTEFGPSDDSAPSDESTSSEDDAQSEESATEDGEGDASTSDEAASDEASTEEYQPE